ncbi:MAG TPA: hypothetical protein VEM32_06210 [Geobacteraceae bacterium]|nr:hypothetical protein [Geobacteraceae bacterium]
MKLPFLRRAGLRPAVIAVGLALCLAPRMAGAEEGPRESLDTALLSPPIKEDQELLLRRLRTVKGDIEAFRVFAENFRSKGEAVHLAQLQQPVDDYLKKHVNNLIAQSAEYATLEGTRLTAETMYVEARLLMSLNREDSARAVIADMKKRFAPYQKIAVELPGKSTTLDEAIRQLDEESAKAVSSQKRQEVP